MSTVCSSMESHRSHIKHSSYTESKQSQTMLNNVATTLPRTLLNQANANKRKRSGNNCDEQVVHTKIAKLKDQSASCSKEKSATEHINPVDEDDVVVIYDSSSNSHSSDAESIKTNTRLNDNKHIDCNMLDANHSTYLNSDVSDTNNNIKDQQSSVGSCRSTFQNVLRNDLSSTEYKENLFINASYCNKQPENGMNDDRTRVGSRKYGETISNASSTIAMEQCPIESNQNDISSSTHPYFIHIGDTVIKMEEELQITDTYEDAVWNSTNVFSMPIVSQVAFEQVRQQPKIECSEEDVVTLSDTEEDTLRYSQLFDGCGMNTSMKQEVKEEVIEEEAEAVLKDSGISPYVSNNKDGSFPHPQLSDRFGMNTSIELQVKEEVIEEEAEAVPKEPDISPYVSNNKDGSFPHPQLSDRYDMNTAIKLEVKEEVIEEEAEAVPKDPGILPYVSNNKDGSFPHPQLSDRFGMNTSIELQVKEEVIEEEAEAVPKDPGISPYVSNNKDGSFPHPQLSDRFGMNTAIKLEIKEEVIEEEAEAVPKNPGILPYVSNNKDGSFPHPQLSDRFGMNTAIKLEIKEEVIEEEAEAVPKNPGILPYVSNNKDGSFPHPQLSDRFDMNTAIKLEVKEEVIEEEAEAVPKDPGILPYVSNNKDGSFPHPQLSDRFGMNTAIKLEVKEEVIEEEAEAVPKDPGILPYVSNNKDGSFPHPQLSDRFGMNTAIKLEVKEEVIEEEAEAVPKDPGISPYVSDNKDGSFPHPQLFDRFGMDTSIKPEIKEEVIEVEVEAAPKDSGVSSYVSDNKDGSFPHPQLLDRFDMNMSMNQEVEEEVSEEEEEEAGPVDSGISSSGNEDLVGSLSNSYDEDYWNWMRKLSRSRTPTSMGRMEVDAVDCAINLKESTNDSTISHKKSFKNKTPNSLDFRRQENDSRPTSSTTAPTVTPSKKSLERKVPQIEPHHLPTRRRSIGANSARQDPEKPSKERLFSKEKKELKEKAKIEDQKKDQKKRRAQNESPDCLPPSKRKATPVTKVEKKQLMDDRKKELKEKTKIEEYTRAKDQKKCRVQNEKKELKEKAKIEEYTRAKEQKKCREQNEKELKEKAKIEEYTRAKDQKKCREQNEKELKEKAKIEEYTRAKNRKKCTVQNEWTAQKMSPLTQEEKKQLIADRKKKLKQIALKERRLSQENNQKNNAENNQGSNQENNQENKQENNQEKKRNTPEMKNTISARKFRNVEEKPKSVDQTAVANDVLASPRTPDSVKDRQAAKEMPTQLQSSSPHSGLGRIPRKSNATKAKTKVSTRDAPEKDVRSQKMKDIESTSKRAEVAKYKSTGPVIVASSILKSPEKKTTKKIDESNVSNRLAGNDAPRKSMNDEITNNFLLHIFRWPPIWLAQQQSHLRLDRTAPVVPDDEPHEMLTHYKSYDEYYRTMLPRVLLETWYEITRNFPPVDNCRQSTLMCSIVENSIETKTLSSNLQLTTLRLEVLVTRKDREKKAYPLEGDLVFFEYPILEQEGRTSIKVFAYVDDDPLTILSDSTQYNKELVNYVERPYALITYTIRTKPLKPGILLNKVARLTRAGKLRPNLQMVQALEYLPKSPLMNLILSPKIEEYCLPTVPIQSEQLFTRDKLNKKQLEAVFKVTETIVQNQTKLCFIQGPPGTGKSTVIINIVSQLLYKKKRYTSSEGALKILVCAPTNAAIDEITLRLLQIRSSMKENRFNIVRIGQTGVTDPIVKDISMTELTKQEIQRTRTSSTNIPLDSVKEKARVKSKINSLKCKMGSTNNMRDCEERLQMKLARLRMKMARLIKEESVRIQQDAETAVLSQADIITCTLSSIYNKQTETFFMANKMGISACIMDEATHSTEAETLIPLMLGVNTLVLVGDPNQLPAPIPSPRGKIEGWDQSIFSRVQNAFETNPANPIIRLDTQYRMSRDICRWPSKFLYAGNLETGTPPNEEFPFHSYRLFNIHTSQNNDNSNTAEAQFVANMMYTMVTQANLDGWECISYGILTPYNNQKPVILAKINDILSLLPDIIRKKIKFEVSTIDGFRGKERDVVILSCVRSQHIGCLSDKQRLSVALTRAKHSLIICGNIGLFNKDRIWNSLLSDAKSRKVYFKVNAQAESREIKPLVVKRFRCSR